MPVSLVGSFSRVAYRLKLASAGFFAILFIGTLGYKLLSPDSPWFDCLYMTVITISTIGYTEIVDLSNNNPARVFTIFIAFSGIGILTYLLSNIAALLIEGDLQHKFIMRKMEKRMDNFENHFVVCGAGRVGKQIIEELHQTQRSCTFADLDEEVVRNLHHQFPNAVGIAGDCTEDDILHKLGVEKASGLFIATDDDNANLVICVSAKQLNSQLRIIAMCKDQRHTRKLRTVGATQVVSPTFIGGMRMVSEMIRPHVMNFMEMIREEDNLRIEEVNIPSKFNHQPLTELKIHNLENTFVMAIREGNQWHIKPKEQYIIQPNSILLVMTTPEERLELEKMCS